MSHGAKVGIFWGVANDSEKGAQFTIVADTTDLASAEPYGTFLTHPRGHFDVWEQWRKLAPVGLKRQGLPVAIAWHEYEEFPRGRIVYCTVTEEFTIYADRKLQSPIIVAEIVRAFGLEDARCQVKSDAHYR
jgi:hypothetical protein